MATFSRSAVANTCFSSANNRGCRSSSQFAKRSAVEAVFPNAVCDVLAAVGVAAEHITAERSQMSQILFDRTNNRSLLGTLNDFAFMAQHGNANLAEPESPEELVRFLAQTPILPLNGASPIELTRTAFGAPNTH
jgi:hypothetical protein